MILFQYGLWILGFLTYVNGAKLDNFGDDFKYGIPEKKEDAAYGTITNDLQHTDQDAHNIPIPLKLEDSVKAKLKNILIDSGQGIHNIIQPSGKESAASMEEIHDINNVESNSEINPDPEMKDQHMPKIDDIQDFDNNGMDLAPEVDNTGDNTADMDLTQDVVNTVNADVGIPDLLSFYGDEEESKEDGLKCSLRQTMAWRECEKKVACDYTCKTESDCTFPYCNSLGLCECTPVFCRTDRMCHFFRIECHGNFTCRNSNCYCE